MIGESMKINTTLTKLKLEMMIRKERGNKMGEDNNKQRNEVKRNEWIWTDCMIGDEGARVLAESLRINTTLTKLNLYGLTNMKRILWKEMNK